MAKNLFSVPIFFILLRESLEASIIVSVLLSLVEQIVVSPDALHSESTDGLATAAAFPGRSDAPSGSTEGSGTATPDSQVKDVRNTEEPSNDNASIAIQNTTSENEAGEIRRSELLRRLRWQIVLGAGLGLLLALVIGAAFVAVWFIKVVDLFSAAEEIWEGVFSLIAYVTYGSCQDKWRRKLSHAFAAKGQNPSDDQSGRAGVRMLFMLPFVTVLREGLEAVVFIGGVSLGQPASSIPLAALAGLVIGLVVGYLIYASSSRARLSAFLITSTSLLLLIGAGLMSKAVGAFERHRFNVMVGGDVAEAGDGPGSFDVVGNIWHLDCCNPENKLDAKGWAVFNAILGWSNNGSIGTVISYIAYWLIAILALVRMKHREGRTTIVNKFVNVTGHSRFRNAIRKRNVERRAQSTELSS
ncbi:Iron permease FTR1 family [Rhizoctonia solani]|uniref:Iron permease FTR1 family n=1 Tax=Rhizoctonia solani TaxID=456999 RepID=A0A8H7I3A0_9AGAM|nr:Iron permease FTR1 family [Rhizoctonia solani]